jgi:GLPGLI family protein
MRLYSFLFLLISCVLYSQSDQLQSEFEVIYKVRMYPDTLSKSNPDEEYLSLLINNNKSLFKSTQKAKSDSIVLAIGKQQFANPVDGKVVLNMEKVPRVRFKSEVFNDGGKQMVYQELLRNRFSYPLEDPINWKTENATKIIGTYKCKKAVGEYKGREYVAWYTETVPIPDGPYVFKGLPGLVLEVYDTKDYVNFSMVSFKKVSKPIIPMKDVAPTKYETFYKARQNFLDNPAGMISNQTGRVLKPSHAARINSNARRSNNFID